MRTSASIRLPRTRTDPYAARIDRYRPGQLLVIGTCLYATVPLAFTLVDALFQKWGWPLVSGHGVTRLGFLEIFYFNWITILTVGYGDYSPISFGWVLSVFEALLGVGFFGGLVAIVTLKLLTPPRNTIVFSQYGYYCLEEERFCVVFINASRSVLVNPEMCSYYHQATKGETRPPFRVPFIGKNVSVFPLEPMTVTQLCSAKPNHDALRFGISVQLGLSTISAFAEYTPSDILVIPSRQVLHANLQRSTVDPGAPGFEQRFHFRPADAPTLLAFLQSKRRERARKSRKAAACAN